ncbi:type VI secretion system-associated FHA domain protein TagH [Marinobacter sp. BGYM27]|uniref:type VI secretion system-associated FHA domain protein TagH n=1 Tax=Marinobacter sp. BGYM27 TaxID=2975597 RepID=UPI0021A6F729|nr:type VI secretion system-associated FHA domain protein TagH [Marinobacter sp. BGYM27]MDG5501108.1 type VI secretion system-associated FHA domain protein TagH [Marinobacter sp. BGYM27]
MSAAQQHSLKLTISNPREVSGGADIQCEFSTRGGSIGSAASDTWKLSPHRTGVVSGHAEIRFIDGEYCLIDRSGRTYINSASLPVGRGRRARLSEGDIIRLGRYQVQARMFSATDAGSSQLAGEQDDHSMMHLSEGELHQGNTDGIVRTDPLTGLQPAISEREQRDPLEGIDPRPVKPEQKEDETSRLLADNPQWRGGKPASREDGRDDRDVALGLPVLNGGKKPMSEHQGTMASVPADHEYDEHSRKHISGAPLLRGMETDLSFQDSDDMRLFLEEAGQTLKATVAGLLDLHQNEDTRHQALRTRLQPIEDNPLRLGQDYEAAMQTLFASERSPVHLSAPAAVTESLTGLRHHQQATQAAISEALDAILRAFSPDNLLRRFHGYRRGLQTGESEPAWAWAMYQHYYDELSSSRQRGFERLFEEVFEQAYDHHLRQLQRESML